MMQLGTKGRGHSGGLNWHPTQCQHVEMQIVWVDVSIISFMKKGGHEFDPVRELSLNLHSGLQEL